MVGIRKDLLLSHLKNMGTKTSIIVRDYYEREYFGWIATFRCVYELCYKKYNKENLGLFCGIMFSIYFIFYKTTKNLVVPEAYILNFCFFDRLRYLIPELDDIEELN